MNNEFEHGHVEFELAGVKYQADFAVVGGLIQLSLLDRKVVMESNCPAPLIKKVPFTYSNSSP